MKRHGFILGIAISCGLTGLLLQANQAPQTGPAAEKRFPPLKVPPGFKATLFACDPLIEYPSVIAASPRPGALYVAIDYMTGLGSDGKVKSEVRLVEDTDGDGYADKAVAVAKGFNSIQGLAYHDGTLFVMHAPFLTAIRGAERKDLLSGLGLKPEDNQSRLHSANGVVVGHDGWLYLALGDNGVDVPRPEGDRLIHNGGAILRCRPDGRDLHIFSTGLRNIYDIALDAELNVFTRDNENDGGTYMIRVCHSFFGADHGYPYDYYERPDHALKPIGDFGLGSSAGGVCYLETQFPKVYCGNLFFAEWGKSVVRYPLKRAGSGFAPVNEIEFAAGSPKDAYPFKPTDVVVQRDGTLMVADYADGQRPKRGRGRIYHIAYVGTDAEPLQKKADAQPLLNPLNSASYYERWEAQKMWERADDKKFASLGKLPHVGRARMHIVWALARRGGPKVMETLFDIARTDDTLFAVRAQAIRAIADLSDPILVKHKLDAGRGDAEIARLLAALPERENPHVLMEIVIALGRLRWADAPAWLKENVKKPDGPLAHAAMQTLRRADNWPEVLKLLDLPDDHPMRTIALRAVADQHDATVVNGVMDRLANVTDGKRKGQYAEILARVYKKPGPWKYWGYRPGPRPANTVVWERSETIEKTFEKLLIDANFDVRMSALKQMQREKVPVASSSLIAWLDKERDPARAAMLITMLGEKPNMEARTVLYRAIIGDRANIANRLLALDLYVKAGGEKDFMTMAIDMDADHTAVMAEVLRRLAKQAAQAPVTQFIKRLDSKNAEVRAAAIAGLGEIRAPDMEERVLKLMNDDDARVRRAAAGAAGKLGVKAAIEPLLKLGASADVDTRGACLDSLRLLREPRALKFALVGLNEPALELKALACIAELGGPSEAKIVSEFAQRNLSTEVTASAVRALTLWRERAGLGDKEKQELNRAVAEIHGVSGVIAQWDVSVPYNQGGRDGIIKFMGVPSKRTKFWQPHFSAGAEGRLTLAPIKEAAQSIRFLLSDIDVPQALPVEFLASSKGTMEVWLNGKSIHRRAAPGKYVIDSDRFAAELQQGMNRLLLDPGPADAAIEFHLRFRRKSAKAEHEKFTQAALARAGNADRGKRLFFDKERVQCIKCHQLGTQGEKIGPELTGVGARFSRIHIIESILEPSRTIAPSFGTFVVTLKSGKTLNGVKLAETESGVTIADNQGHKHVLAKKDIDELTPSPISSMPEGLELRWTTDEFVDLIAFLTSQKETRPRE